MRRLQCGASVCISAGRHASGSKRISLLPSRTCESAPHPYSEPRMVRDKPPDQLAGQRADRQARQAAAQRGQAGCFRSNSSRCLRATACCSYARPAGNKARRRSDHQAWLTLTTSWPLTPGQRDRIKAPGRRYRRRCWRIRQARQRSCLGSALTCFKTCAALRSFARFQVPRGRISDGPCH
jgi:hypothetical protein